jgi:geranylgeranyl reductase
MAMTETFDAVVIGGGPAGSTAAMDLADAGRSVLLLDRDGRIKPCGGAVPPRLLSEFDIPDSLVVARVGGAAVVAPSGNRIDMPIDGGYVGMVDRDEFDEWLRDRAVAHGAERRTGTFTHLDRDPDGVSVVHYREQRAPGRSETTAVRARAVIGADGANSAVAREAMPKSEKVPYVFAYHEIIETPTPGTTAIDGQRCDVYYQGALSPDFYAWIFPHGKTISIGTGTAHKGFSMRDAIRDLRQTTGLDETPTIRCEGAPIPLRPRRRWDNKNDVILAGDAAGVVAPASGEGIFYAMTGGRLAAEAVDMKLATGDARSLALARKRFMKSHGRVFWVLGLLQRFWYTSDRRREQFVNICRDPDVQRLTWEAYMNKKLVRAEPMAHARIFFKDLGHLLGFAPSR